VGRTGFVGIVGAGIDVDSGGFVVAVEDAAREGGMVWEIATVDVAGFPGWRLWRFHVDWSESNKRSPGAPDSESKKAG